MKAVGIIAEYNPFHRGHAWQIGQIRKKLPDCGIIAAMSGDFVQRGEPAVFDKYRRCRMALEGGADLVAEIPSAFATSSAEDFAGAGVSLLEGLGADVISFGMEAEDEAGLHLLADLLVRQPPEYRQALREGLRRGMNYPAARQEAAAALVGRERAGLLSSPNNILGIEYLKAMIRRRSPMSVLAVRRKGSAYHDEDLSHAFSSAAAIRKGLKALKEGSLSARDGDLVRLAMGDKGEEYVKAFLGGESVSWEDLFPYLNYQLTLEENPLEDYLGMQRDMAGRIGHASLKARSIEDLTRELHTRAFTDTAIRRALLHVVLKMKKSADRKNEVSYARILGFSKKGAGLLHRARELDQIKIIQRPSAGRRMLKNDPEAADLYAMDISGELFYEKLAAGHTGREIIHPFTRNQIRI